MTRRLTSLSLEQQVRSVWSTRLNLSASFAGRSRLRDDIFLRHFIAIVSSITDTSQER